MSLPYNPPRGFLIFIILLFVWGFFELIFGWYNNKFNGCSDNDIWKINKVELDGEIVGKDATCEKNLVYFYIKSDSGLYQLSLFRSYDSLFMHAKLGDNLIKHTGSDTFAIYKSGIYKKFTNNCKSDHLCKNGYDFDSAYIDDINDNNFRLLNQ